MGVWQMVREKFIILGSNVTVLGNFNPAILRPDFIEREFAEWGLGQVALASDEAVSLVADIRYEKVRFFMDPNRMIVEDTNLVALENMNGPKIVRDYLRKLPYTPVKMIGLNLLIEVEAGNLAPVWKNIVEPSRVAKLLSNIGCSLINLTVRYTMVECVPCLTEATVFGQDAASMYIQLTLNSAPKELKARVSFNGEFQDVVTNESRINFLAEHSLDVSQTFFKFLDILG
jgi:hypothetical protein